jgi:hypothetical protein
MRENFIWGYSILGPTITCSWTLYNEAFFLTVLRQFFSVVVVPFTVWTFTSGMSAGEGKHFLTRIMFWCKQRQTLTLVEASALAPPLLHKSVRVYVVEICGRELRWFVHLDKIIIWIVLAMKPKCRIVCKRTT